MPIPNLQIKGAEPMPRWPTDTTLDVSKTSNVSPTMPPSSSSPPAPSKKRSRGKRIFVGLVAIFLIVAIPLAIAAAIGVSSARAAKASSERAVAAIEALDFVTAKKELANADRNLVAAKAALAPWKIVRPLPWLGTQQAAVDHTLSAGIATVEAVGPALDLGAQIIELSGKTVDVKSVLSGQVNLLPGDKNLGDLTRDERRAILDKIITAGDTLDLINAKLAEAEKELAKVPQSGVADSLRAVIEPFRAKINSFSDSFAGVLPIAKIVPRLAGYPTPKTYLFFLANNTELRPSAGFFGSYGILKTQDGEIASLVSDDIYNLDLPAKDKVTRPAPAPLQKYLAVDKWYLRDANWSPDFAVSAENAIALYNEESAAIGLAPEKVDGVVAVTPDLALDLLKITGPITVRGIKFTPDNLVDELEYQVEWGFLKTGTPVSDRKLIMGELMQELVHRLTALPASRWREVADAVEKNLQSKQVLFYERDATLEAELRSVGWSGQVASPAGDYLLVADANLAALKTDAVMKRSIAYSIAPRPDGNFEAKASVTYRNLGRFTDFTTRYRTYTRFYVPAGATLIEATGQLANDKLKNPKLAPGAVDVTSELDKTVFGLFTAVEPGEARTLTVRYLLPPAVTAGIKNKSYELLAQKQSGAADYPLTLDLDFGKKVQRGTPGEPQNEWGDNRYRVATDLATDRSFFVGF